MKPLRLWPGVAVALLLVLVALGVPVLMPDAAIFGVLGGVALGVVILLWWLFLSRAPWSERVGALVLMVITVFAVRPIVHDSIVGGLLFVCSIPVLSLALVAWAAASRRLSNGPRRVSMAAAILLGGGLFALVRIGGISGEGIFDVRWRWAESPEARLLAQPSEEPAALARPPAPAAPVEPPVARAGESPAAAPSAPPSPKAPEKGRETRANDKPEAIPPFPAVADTRVLWPGFRGPNRDGVIRGAHIDSDWSKSPPVELWRRPIGPGWSSFAVRGDLVYTQEQRGNDENVSCYHLTTGKLVWRHRDPVRFYEMAGGAGPRSSPTVHNGRVYTLGATGILNALDAGNGAAVWSRNAQADTGAPPPGWGFAGSPLVIDDLVIVATSGRLAGYDAATGSLRWTHKTGGGGYSSPHLATLDGVRQVLLLSGGGATSVSPGDGTRLWQLAGTGGDSIVQPAFTAGGDVLVAAADLMVGTGIRRVAVSHGSSGWTVEERWTSRGLKPYFNDFVVHKGHAYGFDGSILSCIDVENGERKWKGGRYGNGQLILLPDQDLLLVLSQEGELALVKAAPDQFTEIARFKAIEGKTWNHPVLVGNVLLVRNGEEMAAFRLSVQGT